MCAGCDPTRPLRTGRAGGVTAAAALRSPLFCSALGALSRLNSRTKPTRNTAQTRERKREGKEEQPTRRTQRRQCVTGHSDPRQSPPHLQQQQHSARSAPLSTHSTAEHSGAQHRRRLLASSLSFDLCCPACNLTSSSLRLSCCRARSRRISLRPRLSFGSAPPRPLHCAPPTPPTPLSAMDLDVLKVKFTHSNTVRDKKPYTVRHTAHKRGGNGTGAARSAQGRPQLHLRVDRDDGICSPVSVSLRPSHRFSVCAPVRVVRSMRSRFVRVRRSRG